MSRKYILGGPDGHTPIEVEDLTFWANNFEANKRVALDLVESIQVSTVFLGLDHAFGYGPPLLFETMIFGGKHDEYQERYSTWDEAEAGHKRALALAKEPSE